ncbi:MAG: response regulator [Nitrospinae bacterium]|nr:response regulator [Nitrospinota bacterium]
MDKTSKGCILIVDDSHFVRMQLVKTLEKEGYSVLEAESGEFLLQEIRNERGIFHRNKIDLIILDIAMPKIDGIQTAIALKGSPFAGIPIIFNSAMDDKGTVIKALKAGGADYVIKSGGSDLLIGKINKILEKEHLVNLKIGEEKFVFDFYTYLKLEISLAKRAKQPISILILSLSLKGNENEPLHEETITEAITILKVKFRDIDSIARFGPSKIFFILPLTGKEGLKVVEKKVADIIAAHKFASLGITGSFINFKMGRAVFPDDADTWEVMIEKAEEGL